MVTEKELVVDEEFQYIGNNTYKVIIKNINQLVERLLPAVGKFSGLDVEERSKNTPKQLWIPYKTRSIAGTRYCINKHSSILITDALKIVRAYFQQ